MEYEFEVVFTEVRRVKKDLELPLGVKGGERILDRLVREGMRDGAVPADSLSGMGEVLHTDEHVRAVYRSGKRVWPQTRVRRAASSPSASTPSKPAAADA